MRILQVTPYFAPAWAYGGPPRVMFDYAVGLARRGHEVDVLTTDVLDGKRRATPRDEVLDGVRVLRLPNVSNSLAWRTKKYQPRGLVSRLAREIGRYDIVHVTDTRTALTAATYVAARTRNVALCLSAHGSLPSSAGVRGVVKRIYDAALVRPMMERAALLLAQTEHEARLYASFGAAADRIRLLPLPVGLDQVPEFREAGKFKRRLALDVRVRVILFLGRINRLKGLDLLIEAVAPLLDERTVLVVVGRDDGQLGEIVERFRSHLDDGRIRLVGPLYGADRFAAYADADVFCLTPRHYEETSVAALEAAACGTPIVVSEQSDIPGLAASGGGHVVPLEPSAIAAAVAETLERGAEMGRAAQDLVRRQHDRDTVVKLLERYLSDAVDRRSA